jgi:hypothetical protein
MKANSGGQILVGHVFIILTLLPTYFASRGLAQKSVDDVIKQSKDARARYIETMEQGIVRIKANPRESQRPGARDGHRTICIAGQDPDFNRAACR